MMKRFVFRKSWDGYFDWIANISKARNIISSYRAAGECMKKGPDHIFAYHEAIRVYNNYLALKSMLNDRQANHLELRSKHKIPEWGSISSEERDEMYEKWLQIEFPNDSVPLECHTAEEIGAAIKEARVNDGRSMTKVAQLLDISFNTYKCYESGRRMIPANTLLMLEKLYCVKFS